MTLAEMQQLMMGMLQPVRDIWDIVWFRLGSFEFTIGHIIMLSWVAWAGKRLLNAITWSDGDGGKSK